MNEEEISKITDDKRSVLKNDIIENIESLIQKKGEEGWYALEIEIDKRLTNKQVQEVISYFKNKNFLIIDNKSHNLSIKWGKAKERIEEDELKHDIILKIVEELKTEFTSYINLDSENIGKVKKIFDELKGIFKIYSVNLYLNDKDMIIYIYQIEKVILFYESFGFSIFKNGESSGSITFENSDLPPFYEYSEMEKNDIKNYFSKYGIIIHFNRCYNFYYNYSYNKIDWYITTNVSLFKIIRRYFLKRKLTKN